MRIEFLCIGMHDYAGVSPQRRDPDTPACLILHKEEVYVILHKE